MAATPLAVASGCRQQPTDRSVRLGSSGRHDPKALLPLLTHMRHLPALHVAVAKLVFDPIKTKDRHCCKAYRRRSRGVPEIGLGDAMPDRSGPYSPGLPVQLGSNRGRTLPLLGTNAHGSRAARDDRVLFCHEA